ncbi:MAG: pyridoxamine 5'-phosphate oxidase [Natronospirillum sp.]
MDLEAMRRDYSQGGLTETDIEESPFVQFEQWFNDATQAGFSLDVSAMTLATVSPSGQPSQRMVLLKSFDQKGFVFYTHSDSRKGREIKANSKVCLHFPWHPIERQVAVYGEAEPLSEEEVTRYFQSRPRASQIAAWASKQSQKVASREALEEAFEQFEAKFKTCDVPLPPTWGGYRVVPYQVEFWQGRRNRLHDRLVYQRRGAQKWEIERLQP